MWEKNKGTTKRDKRIIICDVETTQCEDRTIKYKDLITWYNKLPTSGTVPQKKGYGRITLKQITVIVKKTWMVQSDGRS